MNTENQKKEKEAMDRMNKTAFLGIDIGGTDVKMGLITEKGEIIAKTETSVSFDGYKTPIIDTVIRCASSFLSSMKESDTCAGYMPAAIGVSATGQVDTEKGIITGAAGHIPGWTGTTVGEDLEKAFGLPVHVENDANCAVLGERWTGAARGVDDVIAVTIGTGVGGGVITGGHLLSGARGIAGELGHIIINGDGELCSCGNRGCLERYGSTTALVRMVSEETDRGNIPAFRDGINGKTIFTRLAEEKAGERADNSAGKNTEQGTLEEVVRCWIAYIADGLVSLVHIFNPAVILIGGGVSAQEDLFIDPLRRQVLSRVMPSYAEDLVIKRAALGNDAGMVGAVAAYIESTGTVF